MASGTLVFVGPVVHSLSKDSVTCIENATITVENGKIIDINLSGSTDELSVNKNATVKKLKAGQFLCPGFIDTHVHAPQYPNIGLGYDKTLLDWLQTYTLPLESKFHDVEFAEDIYRYTVSSSLKCGTTLACYYGTIHTESCLRLASVAAQLGQRALIGKVNMNRNSIPSYVESTADSIQDTKTFLDEIKKIQSPLVEPAITPRFAIACDFELLKALGDLAKQHNTYVQTHICETLNEIELTKQLFPDFKNYAEIYQKAGLLSEKSILGHGIYLSESEKSILAESGSCVAHCANSNCTLRSGMCPVRDLWAAGLKVGLGTDVGGGCNLGLLDAMRSSLNTSIQLSFSRPDYLPLTYHEVFYLATLGGAIAISKGDQLGNFAVGKYFDALVVDMELEKSPAGALTSHSLSELLQKFIYCGSEQNIVEVYVNGKQVKNTVAQQ